MKKNAVLFLILTMIVFLTGCSQKDAVTQQLPRSTSSADTVSSDSSTPPSSFASDNESMSKIAVEVSMPNGWSPVEGSVLPVQYMKNTSSFMVKQEPFASETLDGIVDEALGIYQKSFDNLVVQGETAPLTVDGRDAKEVTFTCSVSGMNMKYRLVFLFVENKAYVITFGDLADSFDTLFEDYSAILNNIKFTVQ